MNNIIKIDGRIYYKISVQDLIHAYNKGKELLCILNDRFGLMNFRFSKHDELGDSIIECSKIYEKIKDDLAVKHNIKYFYFVQL